MSPEPGLQQRRGGGRENGHDPEKSSHEVISSGSGWSPPCRLPCGSHCGLGTSREGASGIVSYLPEVVFLGAVESPVLKRGEYLERGEGVTAVMCS